MSLKESTFTGDAHEIFTVKHNRNFQDALPFGVGSHAMSDSDQQGATPAQSKR